MSLNPQHTEDQLSRLVEGFEWAHGACKKVFDKEVPIFKNRCPNAKLWLYHSIHITIIFKKIQFLAAIKVGRLFIGNNYIEIIT